ncbi:MAG: hypothetical protein H0T84_08585 [Tatlockia sp.]|nr:hypothetical protein [Tatlockia sp.]
MFRFLNKILGATAGIILYPLKTLLITLGLVALYIILLPIIVIGFPILAAFLTATMVEDGKFTAGLFAWLLTGAITVIGLPIVAGAYLLSLTYHGIKDLFRAVRFGAVDGYEGGFFFHVIGRFIFDFSVFNSSLQRSTAYLAQLIGLGSNPLNAEGLNVLYQADEDVDNYFNLVDVPHSSLSEVPDLHERPEARIVQFNPLSLAELQLAEGISDMLGKVVPEYQSLHERLTSLDEDLVKRGDSNDHLAKTWDEVSVIPITQPALLVKQYLDEHGKWRVMPGRTQIIDKPGFEEWLSTSNSHPSTREPLDNANAEIIDGTSRTTRYRIRPYTSMNDAQELVEASITIRKKLQEINPVNIQVGQVVAGISSNFRQTFFGDTQDSANASDQRAGLANNNI